MSYSDLKKAAESILQKVSERKREREERELYEILAEFNISADFELLEGHAPGAIASLVIEIRRLREELSKYTHKEDIGK